MRCPVLVSPDFLCSEDAVLRRTIKDRRALTIYFHALTLDPVRENKKVNAFSVCVSWRHLRHPADMHETNLELGMYQFFWPNYFATFLPIFFWECFVLSEHTQWRRRTWCKLKLGSRTRLVQRRQVLVTPGFLYSDDTVLRRTIKGRRALTNYCHALTLDPVRDNKKVNAFSVCVFWRCLRLVTAARACQE